MQNPGAQSSTPRSQSQGQVQGSLVQTQDIGSLSNVTILSATQAQNEQTGTVFPMADRDKMTSDKLQDFFYRASGPLKNHKYDVMQTKADDPETLTMCYALDQTLQNSRDHLHKYDMLNVFDIIEEAPDGTITTHNLFDSHTQLTVAQVAASNKFYATRIGDADMARYLRQNLQTTYTYFSNNSTSDLLQTVHGSYTLYSNEEKGGPLYFKILLDTLCRHSRETCESLKNSVNALDISTLPGEDVSHACNLIQCTVSYLTQAHSIDHTIGTFSHTFVDQVFKVLQSTSNPDFNGQFSVNSATHRNRMATDAAYRAQSVSDIIAPQLALARTYYAQLTTSGKWDGVEAKKNATQNAFTAKGGTPSTTSGKWGPPTAAEKANRNRRTVDGKEYYYKYDTKRWQPVQSSDPKWKPPTDEEKKNKNQAFHQKTFRLYFSYAKMKD